MALTTLEKCKSYLRITDTTEDEFLSMLVLSVQGTIENYCNRNFSVQSYVREQHIIMHKVFPNNYPIKSIEKILRIGPDIFNLAYLPDDSITAYRIFPAYVEMLDMKFITMGNKIRWANKEDSYCEIDYTAGYEDSEIPTDLSLAATKLVALEYKESRENRLGVEMEREGDAQFTYSKKDSAMPLSIQSVLDRYSKVRV